MATTVATLEAVLRADTSRFNRDIGQAESKMSKFGGVAKAGALAAGAGIAYGLGKVAKIGWDEFNQGQKVAAQTNAVLKSTGGVANVTAKDVENLGKALMMKSGVDDEVIKSGENMLLTFTNIRNEAGKGNKIFDEATKLTLDMSVAMGKDMNSSAIMVGKALNDPIAGLTSLSRVGVKFTEDTKEQIKTLVENGETMKAQKIILGELRTEFGGSAKAAGETFGGQINILRERFNNWAGDMTAKAIPLLQRFGQWLMPLVEKAVRFVGDVINDVVKPAVESFADTIRKHEPELRRIWERVSRAVEVMWQIVRPILKFLLTEVLPRYLGIAIKAIDKWYSAMESIIEVGKRVVNWFKGTFVKFWINLWEGAKDLFNSFSLWIQEKALKTVLAVLEPFSHMPSKMGEWARDAKDKVNGQLDAIQEEIRNTRTEANKATGPWNIHFITNAAMVKSKIEDMTAQAKSASGDYAAPDIASSRFRPDVVAALGPALGLAAAMGMGVSSTNRPGARVAGSGAVSDHSYYPSKAVDFVGSTSLMRLFALRVAGLPGVENVIHTPVDGGIWSAGAGWHQLISPITRAGHYNHVHVDTFDQGGWLRPGWTLAGNFTGRPERIGSGEPQVINLNLDGRRFARWLVDLDGRQRRNGGQGLLG